MVLHGATPHAPIFNLLMGPTLPDATDCELAEVCKRKIMEAICACASEPERPIQMGDEHWDRASYLRALRELYDWLDEACSKSEPAVAIITSHNTCSGSC